MRRPTGCLAGRRVAVSRAVSLREIQRGGLGAVRLREPQRAARAHGALNAQILSHVRDRTTALKRQPDTPLDRLWWALPRSWHPQRLSFPADETTEQSPRQDRPGSTLEIAFNDNEHARAVELGHGLRKGDMREFPPGLLCAHRCDPGGGEVAATMDRGRMYRAGRSIPDGAWSYRAGDPAELPRLGFGAERRTLSEMRLGRVFETDKVSAPDTERAGLSVRGPVASVSGSPPTASSITASPRPRSCPCLHKLLTDRGLRALWLTPAI